LVKKVKKIRDIAAEPRFPNMKEPPEFQIQGAFSFISGHSSKSNHEFQYPNLNQGKFTDTIQQS